MATRIVPGEIDPDALPTLPHERLVGMMTDPLKAECRAIEAKLNEDERRNLVAQHDLGQRVQKVRADEAKYGKHAVALVAAACGIDPSQLYRAAQFHAAFPDRKEVEKLMARRGDGGYRFGWAHVLQLVPVDDPERRAELIEVAFRDRLTVRQFHELIFDNHDHTAKRPLRTVSLPRNLSGGLERLTIMTGKLRDQVRVLLPECVLTHLAELPREQINEDVLGRVARIRTELAHLG